MTILAFPGHAGREFSVAARPMTAAPAFVGHAGCVTSSEVRS